MGEAPVVRAGGPAWPVCQSQPCRPLAALDQDAVLGASTHVEQTEPDPGVACAQGGERPELGGNTHVLVLSGLPLIPPCPKSCPIPFSGPLVSCPVYSDGVRKMRGHAALTLWLCRRHLLTPPPYPLSPSTGVTGCTSGTAGWDSPSKGGKRQEGQLFLFLLNPSPCVSGAAGAHLPDGETEA